MTIAVRLMGGLGNQMFQYATGRALALRRRARLELDLGWYRYEGRSAAAQRGFELDCFAFEAELTEIPATTVKEWERRRRWPRPGRPTVIRKADPDLSFDPAVLDAPKDSLLIGFWQSEKYFADAAEAIRRDFTFREPPSGPTARLAAEIAGMNAVSIHVRRGDYVTEAVTHGTLPLDYYQRAVSFVASRVPDPTFVVFSDEPAWTRQALKLDYPVVYVDGNVGRGCEDLRLMSDCRHHIVANSSFSWWGAWLGSAPETMVVAPERWFRDPSIDTRDLIPERWTRL